MDKMLNIFVMRTEEWTFNAKAQLGVLDEKEPQLSQSFPKVGYKPELKRLPKVSFGTVWRFMIEGVESKKQLSTGNPLVKGFNFF